MKLTYNYSTVATNITLLYTRRQWAKQGEDNDPHCSLRMLKQASVDLPSGCLRSNFSNKLSSSRSPSCCLHLWHSDRRSRLGRLKQIDKITRIRMGIRITISFNIVIKGCGGMRRKLMRQNLVVVSKPGGGGGTMGQDGDYKKVRRVSIKDHVRLISKSL